ncbi:hypothetical protein BDN72DRAFT_280812 [Pluteus cervinus]|uniref:Uncharacterized protein n=1 Tax=Pluteus cervinus TaxID=181527 RepID=A0ACD3AEZ7_9AGAR|nr:hypothetical protein BDN72DRAFT_280812 [Pluteus cervinus]
MRSLLPHIVLSSLLSCRTSLNVIHANIADQSQIQILASENEKQKSINHDYVAACHTRWCSM